MSYRRIDMRRVARASRRTTAFAGAWRAAWAGMSALLAATGCSQDDADKPAYAAEIRRTSYGVAHIKAQDDGGLGYGMGYAYAQDNICLLAQMIVTVNGERSRYFGPDAVGGPDVESGSVSVNNLQSDFFFKLLNAPQPVATAWRQQPPEIQERMRGYAAGFNRLLAERTLAGLPAACRNAPWVRTITPLDLLKFARRLTVEVGSLQFMQALVAAKPPEGRGDAAAASGASDPLARRERESADATLPQPPAYRLGSNAVALGKLATENGRGLLLGNPHYPWYGSLRFYQIHLTIPGKLDVMGATLGGIPVVVIGFNRQLAWTHTVNTSRHATLYALQLDAKDPTQYRSDGKLHALTRRTVKVDVLGDDGRVTQRTHDFWMSGYGPIVAPHPELSWSTRTAYALRDANFDNHRMVSAWYAMNRAESLDQMQRSITQIVGIPWVNTLAVDAVGGTLYTDVTVVPYLTEQQQHECVAPSAKRWEEQGWLVLDARAACAWTVDPAAPQAGIFPGQALPVLRRDDYVQNSNDSAWLTNPEQPLTGFAPLVSAQDYSQGERTRIGIAQIQARLAGTDGLPGKRFNARLLQEIAFSNRSYFGSLLHQDLLRLCRDTTPLTLAGQQVDMRRACATFVGWDQHANLHSTGFPLASAWLDKLVARHDLWRLPFNAQDPVNTPRGLKLSDPDCARIARQALAQSVLELRQRGVDPDQPWGDIQGIELNGRRIPIHGGGDTYNAMVSVPAGPLANVRFGASYIQVVEFDQHGPRAQGFLTYSQSSDPASPHFADQTPRFSALDWIVMPFTERQIQADAHYSRQEIAE